MSANGRHEVDAARLNQARRKVADIRSRQLLLAMSGDIRQSAAVAGQVHRRPDGEWDYDHVDDARPSPPSAA